MVDRIDRLILRLSAIANRHELQLQHKEIGPMSSGFATYCSRNLDVRIILDREQGFIELKGKRLLAKWIPLSQIMSYLSLSNLPRETDFENEIKYLDRNFLTLAKRFDSHLDRLDLKLIHFQFCEHIKHWRETRN
jgi:hypothetical protein